jgi:hypothetical protein
VRTADKPYHLHVTIVWRCGSLNPLETSGPIQGILKPFFLNYNLFNVTKWRDHGPNLVENTLIRIPMFVTLKTVVLTSNSTLSYMNTNEINQQPKNLQNTGDTQYTRQ